MKKLGEFIGKLILLLLYLGFTGLSFADDEDYDFEKNMQLPYVDCLPMLFFQNNIMTVASVQMSEILNNINPEQLDLVLSYVLPEDNERVSNGEQPTFAELIQVRTISNDCKGVSYSLFEEAVAQAKSIHLKADGFLDQANAAIIEQEAKLKNNPDTTEDKTIRVFVPITPFIKEKNAFASTMMDFKHQTIDGQIVETARLTTTLFIFIHDRLLNVAFYSNSTQTEDLALHESKVKKWYKAFIENTAVAKVEPKEKKNTYEDGKAAIDKRDYQTAYSIFLPLAEQGNHDAQDWLSTFYEWGTGVSQDDKKAFYWKRKAAESGNKIRQYQLGNLYYQGKGTAQSFKDAANWYRKAAEKGHASSQIALAFKYRNGEGVLKSSKEAFNWFMKAALQGRAEAQNAVGHMYYEGEGVLKNPKEAFNWFMKAALQGNAKSQYSLGRSYFLGEGTLKSLKDAAYWVKKAYENESDTSAVSAAEKVWNDFELWKYIDNQ